jgi:hypothetical protein
LLNWDYWIDDFEQRRETALAWLFIGRGVLVRTDSGENVDSIVRHRTASMSSVRPTDFMTATSFLDGHDHVHAIRDYAAAALARAGLSCNVIAYETAHNPLSVDVFPSDYARLSEIFVEFRGWDDTLARSERLSALLTDQGR